MIKRYVPILLLLACLITGHTYAEIIHVGSGQTYTSIQPGLDAAVNGDTVLIHDGTYSGTGNKDLDFAGKAITVTSENGAGAVTIDCESGGRGFNFHTGETTSSVLDGVTIINGNVGYQDGGGIVCSQASPRIINCVIRDCYALFGGAIHCATASPEIFNCLIRNNTADINLPELGAEGGGLDCYNDANPLVVNCLFIANWAKSFGGGINCESSSPTIINCTITGNECEIGSGICGRSSSPVVTNCILWNYTVDPEQIFITPGSPDISFCNIQDSSGHTYPDSISVNPMYIAGPSGGYYLAHVAAGQPENSPCIDTGSDTAEMICFSDLSGTVCLNNLSTQSDEVADFGQVDMGYHYTAISVPTPTPTPGEFTATPLPTESPYPTYTPQPTYSPRPTFTALPTFTPAPTPPPSDIQPITLELWMPSTHFEPGDPCAVNLGIHNDGDRVDSAQLVVMLILQEGVWFWPAWQSSLNAMPMSIEPGQRTVIILPEFTWPDAGTYPSVIFMALTTDEQFTELISNIDIWNWSFGP